MDWFGRKSKKQLHVLKRKFSISKGINKTLGAKIELLEARIVAQKEDIERLLDHNRQLANPPRYTRSSSPIHVSESEEDIQFAKDAGLLSMAEAEDMLRELDFENPSIYEDESALF